MPILTMVKTRMSRRQSAGLLASGTLSSAIISSKHLLDHAAGALVFFNGTTDDDGVCFVWHGIASLQHATSLLAYRCTRNRRYEVSEYEHLQLLSDEGILYNKVPRKEKKCNKTNSVEFKHYPAAKVTSKSSPVGGFPAGFASSIAAAPFSITGHEKRL